MKFFNQHFSLLLFLLGYFLLTNLSAQNTCTIGTPPSNFGPIWRNDTLGQSFIACKTGSIKTIKINKTALGNDGENVVLNISQEEKVKNPIYTQLVGTIPGSFFAPTATFNLTTPLPVIGGQTYTFYFTGNLDFVGFQVPGNAYSGGRYYAQGAFVEDGSDFTFEVIIDNTVDCVPTSSIYPFTFNNKEYEIVKQKKTWASAVACAVERGGYLAHIDSPEEQAGLYQAIKDAGISNNYTSVADGGGAAYVWIGATDKFTEGKWVWAGDGIDNNTNFWNGKGSGGNAVNGRFHRWGNSTTGGQRVEPDDYENNQDAAAIALSSWPYGVAGEWNDININNELYYIIEKGATPCHLVAAAPTITEIYNTFVYINFTAVPSAKDYTIEYKRQGDTEWISVPNVSPYPYLLINLTPDTKYVARIITNCANGEAGVPSPETIFSTAKDCNPPTTTVSPISMTTARVNWTPTTGIKGYELRYQVKDPFSVWEQPYKNVGADASFADFTNLKLGTTYQYQIRMQCNDDYFSDYSDVREFTTKTCEAPITTVSQVRYTSARVNWAVINTSQGFELRYRIKGKTDWFASLTATGSATFIDISNLTIGTTYEYEVRLKCTASGFSPYSATAEFTTAFCEVPQTTVSNITYISARINWTASTGISGYDVRYKAKGAATWIPKTAIGTATFMDLTNLVLGTTYEYQIRLKCTATNTSEYSATREFTTQICAAPTAPIASQLTLTSARIGWAGVTGALGYELRYRTKGATTWIPKTATPTTTFINLTNLLPGTTYEYELRLKCTSTGFSAYSVTKEFMTVSCGVPNPVASDMTLSTARVSWSAISGGLGYELRYRAKGATAWTLKTATATTTFLNLTNLLPGTTYEYELRLKCTSTGFSAYSVTKEFTTISCGVPTPSVLQINYAAARIGWTAIGGALGYELRYRVKGVTTWTIKTATATATFIDLTALKINTVYEYQMRLKCTTTGFSAYTIIKEFSTNSCLPVTPSVRGITTTSITVQWTPQTGVSGYEVSYRKKGATTWIAKSVTGAATSSFNLTALTKSTTYEIRMLTKCLATNGSSVYSDIIEAATPAQSGADEVSLEMPITTISQAAKENRMTISPNPTTGVIALQIQCIEKGVGDIMVSDNLGRVVLLQKNILIEEGQHVQELNLSSLNNGLYFVKLVKGQWQETHKILLNK